MLRQRCANGLVGMSRQRRIGVQETEYFTRRPLRAGIHLNRPAFTGYDDTIAMRTGKFRGAVVAAAIDDNDFATLLAARTQGFEEASK